MELHDDDIIWLLLLLLLLLLMMIIRLHQKLDRLRSLQFQ